MKRLNIFRSNFLFPTTNFVVGMGSIANVAGNYYNFNSYSSQEEADGKAILSDWGSVGVDIKRAQMDYLKKHGAKK